MKKLLLSLIVLISTALTSLAGLVPGAYENNRGQTKYVVDQSGKEIYVIDSDGNVNYILDVVSESYDSESGTTIVYVVRRGFSNQMRMENWRENGEIYLHDGYRQLRRN